MRKKILIVCITILLVILSLSGCFESENETTEENRLDENSVKINIFNNCSGLAEVKIMVKSSDCKRAREIITATLNEHNLE